MKKAIDVSGGQQISATEWNRCMQQLERVNNISAQYPLQLVNNGAGVMLSWIDPNERPCCVGKLTVADPANSGKFSWVETYYNSGTDTYDTVPGGLSGLYGGPNPARQVDYTYPLLSFTAGAIVLLTYDKTGEDWLFEGGQSLSVQPTTIIPAWQASHSFEWLAFVRPTVNNGYYYQMTSRSPLYRDQNGTSGSSEPTWGTTVGALTSDNDIRWNCVGHYSPQIPLEIVNGVCRYLAFDKTSGLSVTTTATESVVTIAPATQSTAGSLTPLRQDIYGEKAFRSNVFIQADPITETPDPANIDSGCGLYINTTDIDTPTAGPYSCLYQANGLSGNYYTKWANINGANQEFIQMSTNNNYIWFGNMSNSVVPQLRISSGTAGFYYAGPNTLTTDPVGNVFLSGLCITVGSGGVTGTYGG